MEEKSYELSNHLGNVHITLSDYRRKKEDDQGEVTYFSQVKSASDYYPFGQLLTEGNYSAEDYRFGFNGKEMDNEVKGTGNQYDYGFRIYNPRIAKFLSVDPLTKDYPWYTPYQFAGNKPIIAIDIDGLEEFEVISNPLLKSKPKLQEAIKQGQKAYEVYHSVIHGISDDIRKSLNETGLYGQIEYGSDKFEAIYQSVEENIETKTLLKPSAKSLRKNPELEYSIVSIEIYYSGTSTKENKKKETKDLAKDAGRMIKKHGVKSFNIIRKKGPSFFGKRIVGPLGYLLKSEELGKGSSLPEQDASIKKSIKNQTLNILDRYMRNLKKNSKNNSE